jgi:hypothetical protein
MKVCSVCGIEKPDEEFAWRYKDKGIRQNRCKLCQHAYQKVWYQLNKKEHKEATAANRDRYIKENFENLVTYLREHPCVDCGEADPIVLEFDHRGDKKRNISEMITSPVRWEKILLEIQKCDVRCCNCHRRKTTKQFGWGRAQFCDAI